MDFAPNTIVELKYTGKKIPFTFKNPMMNCGSLTWNERGEAVKCEYQDALVLIKGSGDDFKIVSHVTVDQSSSARSQHRQPEAPKDDDIPYLSGDGVDGTDGVVVPEVPRRGRPRKSVQDE